MTTSDSRCTFKRGPNWNCGSYAFNLRRDGIEQGTLCDVHYWQTQVENLEIATRDAKEERDRYRSGNTHLLGLMMHFVEETPGTDADAMKVLRSAGMLNADDSMNWPALKDRKPKQQTEEEAVRECVTDPAEEARLLALGDDEPGPNQS